MLDDNNNHDSLDPDAMLLALGTALTTTIILRGKYYGKGIKSEGSSS
jgi:hypothetical protein